MRSATEPTAAANPPAPSRFRVRLERWNRKLHYYYFIKADLALNRVTLRHSKVNLWGVMKVLHVFSGVQLDYCWQPRQVM